MLKSFADITGPMLLGHLLNYALMGVLAVQVYIYALSFPRDFWPIKTIVYLVLITDIIQTCFASHYAWYVLAAGWGDPRVLNFTPWSLSTIPPLAGFIALIVQQFLCWRIWTLARKRRLFIPLVGLISITSVGSCCVAFYTGGLSGSLRNVAEADLLDAPVVGWLSTSMTCDILITITLVIQLSARKNKGFGSLDDVVHRAIRMAIETGAITSISVIVELILYLQSNLTSWYFLLGMIVGKLYSNSLMANLNSRSPLFKDKKTDEEFGVHVWKKNEPLDIRVTASSTTAANSPGDPLGDPLVKKNDVELRGLHDTRSRSPNEEGSF